MNIISTFSNYLYSLPVALLFTLFFFGALIRGHFMYSVAKYATEKTLQNTHPKRKYAQKMQAWLSSGGADYGLKIVQRWGLLAVPLSYLTFGVQSVIQAAAGVLQINRWHFFLAQIPGCIAWAAIYTTIGMAIWKAMILAALHSPLVLSAVILGIVLVVVISIILVRRHNQQLS